MSSVPDSTFFSADVFAGSPSVGETGYADSGLGTADTGTTFVGSNYGAGGNGPGLTVYGPLGPPEPSGTGVVSPSGGVPAAGSFLSEAAAGIPAVQSGYNSSGQYVGGSFSPAQIAQQYAANPPANQPLNNYAGGLLGAAGQVLGGFLVPVTQQAQNAAAIQAAQLQQAANNQKIAQYALIGGIALVVLLIAMKGGGK